MGSGIVITVSAHAERQAKARLGWDHATLCQRAFDALSRVVNVESSKPAMRCRHRGVDFLWNPNEDGSMALLTVFPAKKKHGEEDDAADIHASARDRRR